MNKGFSLCFSNWAICEECAATANDPVNAKRWEDLDECFKCKKKEGKGFRNDPSWASEIYLCPDCINWANEILNIKKQKMPEEIRYSDAELEEFRTIIYNKLTIARKELDYLREKIAAKTAIPSTNLNRLDDETNKVIELRDRQSAFIESLEAAVVRIDDKTYGICEKSGQLIDKDRLRAVPQATYNLPTRKKQKLQTCRVCGCTDDNCSQCIEKTGSPCHWVEDDLCSACLPINEEKVKAGLIQTGVIPILNSNLNNNDMNFFTQLNTIAAGADLSITLKEKNGKYTMCLLPNIGSKAVIKPLLVTGTPAELDDKFFELISKPLQEAFATIKNADEFNKSIEDSVKKEDAKPQEKKKPETKTAEKKAAAKPKKAPEKKEVKIDEPDLFAAE